MFIKDTKYDVLVNISFFLFELNRIGDVMVGVFAILGTNTAPYISIRSELVIDV
jgi:hypothetical protein